MTLVWSYRKPSMRYSSRRNVAFPIRNARTSGLAKSNTRPPAWPIGEKYSDLSNRVVVLAVIAIEEVDALIAEIPARVVVHDVEDDGDPVHVGQIDECLELARFPREIADAVRREPLRGEQPIQPPDIRGQVSLRDREFRFGRVVIHAVVAEAEPRGELLNRQQLHRRDPEVREIGSFSATSRNVPGRGGQRGVEYTPTCS